MKRSTYVLLAVGGLLIGGLTALLFQPGARLSISAPVVSVGKALVGGPFALIDHTGKRVTDQDFRGRYMLIMFGFT